MELLGIYAIYDKKGERYDTPFFAVSDLFAKRRFGLMIDEPQSILNKYLKDFELFKIGTTNIISGVVKPDFRVVLEGKQITKMEEK